jgi:hypothetical protein
VVKAPHKSPIRYTNTFPALSTFTWFAIIAISATILYFKLPSFIEIDKDGNYSLSEKRLKEYEDKVGRSENAEKLEKN